MATDVTNVLEEVYQQIFSGNPTSDPFDHQVYTVDLNGDGNLDLLFAGNRGDSAPYSIETILATSTGFTYRQNVMEEFPNNQVAVGRTADGTAYIVLDDIQATPSQAYTVFRGNGDGTFTDLGSGATAPTLTTTYSPLSLGKGRATDDTVTFNADGTITVGPPPATPSLYPSQTYSFPTDYPYTTTTPANLEYVISSGPSFLLVFSYTAAQQAAAGTTLENEDLAGSLETPCLAEGTRVLTTRGEVAVEALREGDLVATLLGGGEGAGLAPVRWLGHRTLDLRAHPEPAAVRPVRVRAGALGEGRPHRDLVVSPGHALFLDGVLVQASRLVNGHSVVQEPWERVTYWHVELPRHDVLLAEGAPTESFLDTGNRGAFTNGGVPVELHPDFRARRMAETCAPLVEGGERLERIKARLLGRARALFDARDTAEPALHLLADGIALWPEAVGGAHRFHVPPGCRTLRLASRRWVPAELLSASTDARTLGVCVRALRLDGAELPLDDAALAAGWHAPERDGEAALRWTAGEAALPVGARTVEVVLGGFARYWVEEAAAESVAA